MTATSPDGDSLSGANGIYEYLIINVTKEICVGVIRNVLEWGWKGVGNKQMEQVPNN